MVEESIQVALILKSAPYYENSLPLPQELLMKIFHDVVRTSDHPIRDLCNLAQVCEIWRQMILGSPSLWSRFDFNRLPITDNNLRTLSKIVDNKPAILSHINEISLKGTINSKDSRSASFLDKIITAPNVRELHIHGLDSRNRYVLLNHILRAITRCRNLKKLSIKHARQLVGQQKWLADHLIENGKQLEELHLTSSIIAVSSQLFRAISSEHCPMLRVLDISTCDIINTRSFDAIQLSNNMPNLEILRVANVSFKRVHFAPEIPGLRKLEELSMPIGMRDTERDDALLATLTYGSDRITTLDLRGSSITANALENLPSSNIRELHIDDICPITRRLYQKFINRWRHSLEVLSLVKINCSETIRTCLLALVQGNDDDDHAGIDKPLKPIIIRELDLESSDVEPHDLKRFLSKAKTLETINLSSCRSLPRGCKGCYVKNSASKEAKISDLKARLGSIGSDSETEIDSSNHDLNDFDRGRPDRHRRIKRSRRR